MSAPVRPYRIPGGQTDDQVEMLRQWARANKIDPATVDGVIGFEVYPGEKLIRWREHTGAAGAGTPRADALLVEPSPELLAALGVPVQEPRGRGVVLVDEEYLGRLLALPGSWRVLGFQPFPIRMSIGVLVEGPDLPVCALGAEPPFVEPPDAPPLTSRGGGEMQARLLPLVRAAIAGAADRCDHGDPGYDVGGPPRTCVECAAAAVVELLAGPALQVTFTR